MDWKDIKNDREKYAAYLCSRDWSVLREQVRERAGDKCERCKSNSMNACHHLTHERKYNERVEDLQAICNGCHEFTHGKNDIDPAKLNKDWIAYTTECEASRCNPIAHEDAYDCRVAGPIGIADDTFAAALAIIVELGNLETIYNDSPREIIGSHIEDVREYLKKNDKIFRSACLWDSHGWPCPNTERLAEINA